MPAISVLRRCFDLVAQTSERSEGIGRVCWRRARSIRDQIWRLRETSTWRRRRQAFRRSSSPQALLMKALDVFLDFDQPIEAALDRIGRNVAQHIRGDRIAQAVEIVDELVPAFGRYNLLARRSLGSCRRSSSPCSTSRSSSRTSEIGCSSSTSARSTCESPPAGAAETARSIARAWCRAPWRGCRYNCAAGANSRRVGRSADVSDRATLRVYGVGLAVPNLSNCLGFSSYSVFTH